ncbi:hypothetical protein [Alterinioella nitratireducens]|uniref:hypothetical protein n=1 Tax=Alterinioella nitratireducens TaxID=2735915 RepID=UPI0015517A4A|nr:hypothetical protein [Alterinioella nitratireducens]NPD18420.1 hypothetical protein [Alterinioella nitratireducens]
MKSAAISLDLLTPYLEHQKAAKVAQDYPRLFTIEDQSSQSPQETEEEKPR